MDLLERRITGDWIEVREKLNVPVRLRAYLKLDDQRLQSLASDLRGAALAGIVEYKRRAVGGVFNFLTRLTYTTPNQAEILGAEADLRLITYVLGYQTQFATGQLRPAKEAESSLNSGGSRSRQPLEEVVAEVKARVANNPELAKNPHVKNIFMEIQLYQREFTNFSNMSLQIPDDRAPTFFENYKRRLDGILDNVHNHYRDIRLAEDEELRAEFLRQEEDQFVVPEYVKLLANQAQELTKLRSSIHHALQEGYQIRNLLLKLTERRDPVLGLLDDELTLLDGRQAPGTQGHPAAVKLARAIAAVLDTPRR